MPKVDVNGVDIAYEVLGEEGPQIVLTSGGIGQDREFTRPLAECLSADHEVMIYDRRNSGQSGLAFGQEQSEWEDMADDLHGLTQSIGWEAPYFGGTSGGAIISMIVGYRHPESAKGLLLIWMPSDAPEMVQTFADIYQQSAEVATKDGMEALIEIDDVRWGHWKDHAMKNAAVRDQLLSMEPATFAAIMERCGELALTNLHFAGLSEEQVKQIALPAILIPGNNASHPRHTSQMLRDLMPSACLSDPMEHLGPEIVGLVEALQQSENASMDKVKQEMVYHAPTIAGFIAGVEACRPR